MSRIFLALAIIAVVLLSANLLVGLTIGDFGAASRAFQSAYHEYDQLAESASDRGTLEQSESRLEEAAKRLNEQRSSFWLHIWLGMSAALVTLLVNSISVTYFIGTNRWCREVVDAFALDEDLAQRSQRLKKRAFPWSLTAILLMIVVAGLGAASDPVTLNPDAADWVPYHWGLAMLGIVVIGGCLLAQVALIAKNYQLINEILVAAEHERERRKIAREPVAEG
ncbi:MAG: hypothetical protein H6822_33160 [Planctomycetaceae bacterium]|nr:hypothetical protein [Planctomycetales bacterium]MCB9927036.1 hypothetical protein [Planctomycetaceae bacterium]